MTLDGLALTHTFSPTCGHGTEYSRRSNSTWLSVWQPDERLRLDLVVPKDIPPQVPCLFSSPLPSGRSPMCRMHPPGDIPPEAIKAAFLTST